ncbi:MAG TPA: sugar phosphate isomerase/epimerase [Firmicutes bacterium]|nr:sugar phosphate isomerase/epimerase [Bacillota bacterium]
MKLRHSIMLGTLGRYADRFHCYQPARSLEERLIDIREVIKADGIEIVYPQDFADERTVELVKKSGLPVSAVNVNVKSEDKWRRGSFTAPDEKTRREAVAYLQTGMDLAAELGTDMVTCCPLIDGHNYAFEADYTKQWRWLEEGIYAAASHRSDIKVSLEYKLNESRNFNILSDVGRTLYLCEKLGLPNLGITMDVGHALIAKETPAEAFSLAAAAGRMFYLHLNDNSREWDWDMIPGSVNYWDLLEVLFYVKRLNWSGWISYDVFARDGHPIETLQATISIVNNTIELLDKVGQDKLEELLAGGVAAQTFAHLVKSLL